MESAMSAYETYSPQRFYRSSDAAVLGGVCAGLAEQFGFNLRVLRLLALIALCVAMPIAIIGYLAIVFLVPARSGGGRNAKFASDEASRQCRKARRAERRRARREAKQARHTATEDVAAQVRGKCKALEERLVDLEKHITSRRYQLDQEFSRL